MFILTFEISILVIYLLYCIFLLVYVQNNVETDGDKNFFPYISSLSVFTIKLQGVQENIV